MNVTEGHPEQVALLIQKELVVKMMIIDNLKAELATYKESEVETESEVQILSGGEMDNPVIEWLLSVIGPVLAVYSFLKAQTTRQENRITMLEQQTDFFKTQLERATKRLDNHDEQNKVLIALTEQVKALSDDIRRIEQKIDREM